MWVINLDKTEYDEALQLQEMCHAARRKGRIKDLLMLLEHDQVITFGRSAESDDLLVSEDELEKRGIPVRHVNRGGKITCHYPGQLVGYFIMDLDSFAMDIPAFVKNIEDTLMLMLADYGIAAERIRHRRGVWVNNNKVAAVGIEIRNGITLHGFSLNLKENREIYSLFIPCGISEAGVTAMESLLEHRPVESGDVKKRIMRYWAEVTGKPVTAILSKEELYARMSN